MKDSNRLAWLGALYLLVAAGVPPGCGGDDGDDNTGRLGAEGESCTETSDCEGDLSCVDLECVRSGDAGDDGGADGDPDAATGGGITPAHKDGEGPDDKDSGFRVDKDGGGAGDKDGGDPAYDPFACDVEGETYDKAGKVYTCVNGKWVEQ